MITHQRTLVINATPNAVWAVLSRFMHIDEFAPLVSKVDALTTGEDNVGSKRRCHFTNGTSLVEEVISWNHNKSYTVRLSEMDAMPLEESTAKIAIFPKGAGQTQVVWSSSFRVKYGIFGWLLGQTMMKMMMGKILDGNLKGLADNIGTSKATVAQSA